MGNKIKILMLVAVAAVSCMTASITAAQDTVTIPLADLQQLRRIAVDRDYWKGVADDRAGQLVEANKSAANWEGLYRSEKKRADEIQEGRIKEVKSATADLTGANEKLHKQADADAVKIGQQNARILKLESSRKWYFGVGAAIGAAAGSFVTWKLANKSIVIPGLGRAVNPSQVGFSFQF